jgi:deoxyribodipyrimidine photo-lyase
MNGNADSIKNITDNSGSIQVVWFKRDLRIQDHLPLHTALKNAAASPVVALYCFEPSLSTAPDYAMQHANFATECLRELSQDLAQLNVELLILNCEVLIALEALQVAWPKLILHSHEETGNGQTYRRDIQVQQWCNLHSVQWHEVPSHAVVRRLKSRDDWGTIWNDRMQQALVPLPSAQSSRPEVATVFSDISEQHRSIALRPNQSDKPMRIHGGRKQALALLESFFQERAFEYRTAMSSPLSAQTACSRLSPHIALGVVSVKEVLHRLWKARRPDSLKQLSSNQLMGKAESTIARYLASIKSFESRLHWRCHFVQKLESQPSIEFKNMHDAYDGLRPESTDLRLFNAWASGNTGFPMIDACMRMLQQTGWINFRMRAMLVSFSSYQLWQPWREPALHLAREFLDYEPGIHYSQLQMQSGTTGINTIRMYNPVKQARDQDPTGAFVRQWIPQLAAVPDPWIFEPWTMPALIQEQVGCLLGKDYPLPVIELQEASRRARDLVWGVREEAQFAHQAQAVFQKLGSRNKQREGKRSAKNIKAEATPEAQLDLFS